MKTMHLKINGLTCEACIKIATNRIKKIPGVDAVQIHLETGDAQITSQNVINLTTIQKSLADTHYQIQ